jgi:protein-tyrosine-phosphatase
VPAAKNLLFRRIWRDPVGGSLIAAAIVAFVTYMYSYFRTEELPSLTGKTVQIAALAIVACSAVMLWFRYRRSDRVLVFLSSGGTCRDPMAKVILEQLLLQRRPRPRIQVRAAGLGPLSKNEVSHAARYVIREMYGRDLLKGNRPELLTPELAEQADLILTMDRRLQSNEGKTLPSGRTFLLKDFLGEKGDVRDPFPDGKDQATIERYRACAEELKRLLSAQTDRIVKALDI